MHMAYMHANLLYRLLACAIHCTFQEHIDVDLLTIYSPGDR